MRESPGLLSGTGPSSRGRGHQVVPKLAYRQALASTGNKCKAVREERPIRGKRGRSGECARLRARRGSDRIASVRFGSVRLGSAQSTALRSLVIAQDKKGDRPARARASERQRRRRRSRRREDLVLFIVSAASSAKKKEVDKQTTEMEYRYG